MGCAGAQGVFIFLIFQVKLLGSLRITGMLNPFPLIGDTPERG
jgi:hypothetical protein